ncbi:ACT domain-containing protein [Ferrimonas pelagia]|uniref:ACT domain-containing protein n=1 Tax=Ferrimonas pelagia TaxID=1177826 RepID=A0ABP9ERP4_9GAMM
MAGITELDVLLRSMRPQLMDGEFVFCTVAGPLSQYVTLAPLASFQEPEGLTLILPKARAQAAGIAFEGSYRQITLLVHSSLEAVGLTAAFSACLNQAGISANVVAGYYHDHIFVQSAVAERALAALQQLSG